MATYTLNNSAGDIDDALQKVVAVTTTPLDGNPNMVTSGGVKAYVDTAVTSLNTTVANLADIVTGFNTSSILDSSLVVGSGNRASSLSVNVGTFLNRSTADPLATVDYLTCALYGMTGNHDELTIRRVSIKDNNAYSCVSAVSAKSQKYTTPHGQWQLHDILIIPTLGFSAGNYTFEWDVTGNDDWYIRADITAYIGKPA
tara:strand:+ start:140 stop:739 length:600 start_codon:yes stop_codon:yes gene_type:complete